MYQGDDGRKAYYEVLKKSSGNSSGLRNTVLDEIKVKITVEDKEEIAKDILKIVLQDLNEITSEAIKKLSDDKQKQDVVSTLDFSNEKLQTLFDQAISEVIKEYFRDFIKDLNQKAFNI